MWDASPIEYAVVMTIELIINKESIVFDDIWEGIMYFSFEHGSFPKVNSECDPVVAIEDLLNGIVKLWRKECSFFSTAFMKDNELYDYPIEVRVERIETEANWLISFGSDLYGEFDEKNVVHQEVICPRTFIKNIHFVGKEVYDSCKTQTRYKDALMIESLLKKTSLII